MKTYYTKEGFRVIWLHYTVDPEKSTPEAIEKLVLGYPGGRAGAAWRKEMEIDFTAYSGQLLCYDTIMRYREKIVRHRNTEEMEMYGGFDWGRNNPASFTVYGVDSKKDIHATEEIYLNNISIPAFCQKIKESRNYNRIKWIAADPSLWNRNQETEAGLRSLNDLFEENGIYLVRGKSRDDQLPINELLDRWDRLWEREPRLTIEPCCTSLVWELERLRYKELTTGSIEKQNPHEQLVDKDNHSWDGFKYFISTLLSGAEINDKEEYGALSLKALEVERSLRQPTFN